MLNAILNFIIPFILGFILTHILWISLLRHKIKERENLHFDGKDYFLELYEENNNELP